MGNRTFKDYTKPGPLLDDSRDEELRLALEGELGEPVTCDALAGDFRIFQLKNGHRFSTDDVLTAWYGTQCAPRVERVLDLGSGIGSVGMTAAWRLPFARFETIEAQEKSVRLARASASRNGLEGRYEIRQGDLRGFDARQGSSPGASLFDLVLGSPPYFPPGSGVPGDHPQKIDCRFEMRGDVRDYCLAGLRHLAPGAGLALVFPTLQRARARQAWTEAGGALVRLRPVIFREGEPPLLDLLYLQRVSDLPSKFVETGGFEEPPLVIREASGQTSLEYRALKLSFGFPPSA